MFMGQGAERRLLLYGALVAGAPTARSQVPEMVLVPQTVLGGDSSGAVSLSVVQGLVVGRWTSYLGDTRRNWREAWVRAPSSARGHRVGHARRGGGVSETAEGAPVVYRYAVHPR